MSAPIPEQRQASDSPPVPAALSVGTFNARARMVRKHPDRVVRVIEQLLTGPVDVLTLAEMGSGKVILRELARRGFGVYPGDGSPGAMSTPVVWRPGLDVRRNRTFELTPRTFVGLPGAGLSPFVSRKVTNSVTIRIGGRRVTVLSGHGIASAYLPIRKPLARRYFNALGDVIEQIPGIVVVALDVNRMPGDPMLAPLLSGARPMRSSQLDAGGVPTFNGRRPIDDVFYLHAPGRVRAISLRTFSVPRGFDHVPTVADLSILPRP